MNETQQTPVSVLTAWPQPTHPPPTRPWLVNLLLQRKGRFFHRFLYFYQKLQKLPRLVKRTLQRRLAISLTGMALLLALSHAPSIHAASITVTPGAAGIHDGDGCSLVEAIINANHDAATYSECRPGSGADTIHLPRESTLNYLTAYGTDSALPDIIGPITIAGNRSTIQRDSGAADYFRILFVNSGNLTLNTATISGGNITGKGGGIYSYDGSVTLNHSTLSGNTAYYGGGIFNQSGQVRLNNSTLSGNLASYSSNPYGTYYDESKGGGIYNASGRVTLNHSTVSGNSAFSSYSDFFYNKGGGIYNGSGRVILNHSTISGNFAAYGGGISNRYGQLRINDSMLSDNSGSGIYNYYGGTITVKNSTLSGNIGSGIANGRYGFYRGGTVTVYNSIFNGNGSGIFNGYGGLTTVYNSTLNGNSTGIYNYYSTVTIHNSTISGNTYGGGIHNKGTMTLNNSTVSGNYTASVGVLCCGGGGILNFGILTVNNSTISGNSALGYGGGISNLGTATLNHSTVSDNSAGDRGGGIFNDTGTVTLNNSTISGNSTAAGSGGIFTHYSHEGVTLNNSTVSGNVGYGIYNGFYGGMTLNNSTVSGNSGRGINNVFSTLNLHRSLISGNAGGEIGNFYATTNANDYNLFGHSGLSNAQAFSNFTPGATDITATSDGTLPTILTNILDILLADNSGPTQTHALVPGSPAIDAAPTADCAVPPINGVDQRGVARNDAGCDIGSFELNLTALVPVNRATSVTMSSHP